MRLGRTFHHGTVTPSGQSCPRLAIMTKANGPEKYGILAHAGPLGQAAAGQGLEGLLSHK